MRLIKNENAKAMFRAAIFLIAMGLILFLLGYFGKNYATAFLGLSFSALSFLCLLFVHKDRTRTAKILWGIGTPLLIFISPCLFVLTQPTTVFSYSFLYIGGVLFTAYSFHEKDEKMYMWASIALFFLGLVFYDRIILSRNFSSSQVATLFNENYFHFKTAQIVHFVSLTYLVILIHKNKGSIEKQLSAQIRKLQNFTSNLILSSKSKLIHSGNLIEALKEILRNTSQVMDVSRISIWEMDEENHSLNMVVGYDATNKEFSTTGKLNSKDYPHYLKSLLEEKMIVSNNVLHDPKTREFSESYTLPLGILSMMDAPFFIDGKFKGILCCEEQRHYRKWDEMDQLFSMSVSKLISISYYCCMRKEQYEALAKTSKELELQNSMMDSINQKMMEINGELTNDLFSKEEGMKELKNFIDKVSFKNAHDVRGPLSRMLGLLQLYKVDQDLDNREKYVSYLEQSAQELDEIIKEINQLLAGKRT